MSEKSACNPERMNLERFAARAFVLAGGIFWVVAGFAGPFFFDRVGVGAAISVAIYPFVAMLAILVVGWFYERLAGLLLLAGAAGVMVWGIIFGWETGMWMLMSVVLIAPIATAGVLFLLAGRMSETCRLEQRAAESALRPGVSEPTRTRA